MDLEALQQEVSVRSTSELTRRREEIERLRRKGWGVEMPDLNLEHDLIRAELRARHGRETWERHSDFRRAVLRD